jgi:hypothetical protein
MQVVLRVVQGYKHSLKPAQRFSSADYGQHNKFYYRESPLANKINNDKIPIVLVLGWAASVDKHVLKYAQIYESLGFRTIRIAPSLRLSIFQPNLHKEYAITLLEMIKSKPELEHSPIIIHTFSNAGTFIYRHITEMIHEPDNEYSYLKQNIKTMIYDSGPGHPSSLSKLIKSIAELAQPQLKSIVLAYGFAIIGVLAYYLKLIFSPRRSNFLDQTLKALIQDKVEVPILALISKKDNMIDYRHTFNILKERQKHVPDLKINTVVFEDSAHCSNYSYYGDVYVEKIRKHLAEVKIPFYDK